MAVVVTWSFDPRWSRLDTAEALDRALRASCPPPSPRTTAMQAHIDKIAANKTAAFLERHRCTDCRMELAENSTARRCITCQAHHKAKLTKAHRRKAEARRINRNFVGHTFPDKPTLA